MDVDTKPIVETRPAVDVFAAEEEFKMEGT